MKITRHQLKNLIRESLEADEETGVTEADLEKIKDLIRTLENENIKQAAALCDALGIDFKTLVHQTISELIDSKWKIYDDIQSDVMSQIESIVHKYLGVALYNNEDSKFYIESEPKASDIHQTFYYGTSGSILNYIENCLVQMIIAIGNE